MISPDSGVTYASSVVKHLAGALWTGSKNQNVARAVRPDWMVVGEHQGLVRLVTTTTALERLAGMVTRRSSST